MLMLYVISDVFEFFTYKSPLLYSLENKLLEKNLYSESKNPF